jgi:hypothetical protein
MSLIEKDMMYGQQENRMDLNSSVNIFRTYGINHMQQDSSNYSVDYLKRAAFTDELNNYLKVRRERNVINDNEEIVLKYLEERVAQIDKKYKSN